MKYGSGGAFRRALENRLRNKSLQSGVPLVRLRKMVAFDRFLARLFIYQPNVFVVKGGLAMQLRLGDRSRTTKDIDMLILAQRQEIYPVLRNAGAVDLGDWFLFEVADTIRPVHNDFGGTRYQLNALLDGRTFEGFHLDVGIGDPLIDPIEQLRTPDLLEFAGLKPTLVPCYPITQQIAEKLHAYTRPHPSGESTRVKDFVDILLLAELGEIQGERLFTAIEATFHFRGTHILPKKFPSPPEGWSRSFGRIKVEIGLEYESIDLAYQAMERFLNPILLGDDQGIWSPSYWGWIK